MKHKFFKEAIEKYKVALDYPAGFKLLRKSAALGSIKAHEWLGAVYDYGLGTRANRRKAFEHYLIAANAGNANAQYHIGIFLSEGRGVKRDDKTAARLLLVT